MKFIYDPKFFHRLVRICCAILLIVIMGVSSSQASWALSLNFGPSAQAAAAEQAPQSSYGLCLNQENKIDLNNANIIAFQDCPGFYPTLASLIVQNSPYQSLDDVLEIDGLTDIQKEAIQQNLSAFKLSEPITSMEMRMPPRPSMRSNP